MANGTMMPIPGVPGNEAPISFEVPKNLVTQKQVDEYVKSTYNTALWGIGGAFALYYLRFRPRHLAVLGIGIFGLTAWKQYKKDKGET